MVIVPEKKIPNYNFSLPKPIADEFRRLGDLRGERNKLRWAVASAAVLKLLEMPEEEMDALIQKVIGLRTYDQKLQNMVNEAKAKAMQVGSSGLDEANRLARVEPGPPPDAPKPDAPTAGRSRKSK